MKHEMMISITVYCNVAHIYSNKKVRCPVSKSARNMQFSIKDCDSYRFSLM